MNKVNFNIYIFLLLLVPVHVFGQQGSNILEGSITFRSSRNIYVRFNSTEAINNGDTLFYRQDSTWVPALKVTQKSSTSCVCTNLSTLELKIGDQIIFYDKKITAPDERAEETISPLPIFPAVTPDSIRSDTLKNKNRKQTLNGRLTISTNASLNPSSANNFHRIRTAFSMNVQNIKNSAFSAQTYITYRHRYGIDQNTTGFYDDFKVFALAVQYAPTEKFNVSFGRKINNNIANMGAIDGIQTEFKLEKYTIGLFGGTRPDFKDFSFNATLPQFGIYVVRNDVSSKGSAQTSLALAEQENNFKTDRRFLYFQHNNSLIKNINLFVSSELDLFKKINDVVSNQPSLTSIYFSLRYKIRQNLNISASYDNRRNVIFYESYQTYIDQLLAQETRQGFRLQVNYSPFRSVSINASSFFRYQGSQPVPTKNYVANINLNNIASTSITGAISLNILESYYYNGTIIGGRLSRNFNKNKLNAELNYRNVNYKFFNSESSPLVQHIAGVNLNYNLLKLTSLNVSYEGTFDTKNTYHRYFITIVQRFKQ